VGLPSCAEPTCGSHTGSQKWLRFRLSMRTAADGRKSPEGSGPGQSQSVDAAYEADQAGALVLSLSRSVARSRSY